MSTSEETFVSARAEHSTVLLELMRQFYRDEDYSFDEKSVLDAITSFQAHPDWGRMWIVEMEGQPVGYLALTFGFSFEYGGRDAVIDEFFVLKEYRSRNLSRRMMDFAEARAANEGIRAIHLMVERKNRGAARLYKNRGYVSTNRRLLTKHPLPPTDETGKDS